MKKLFILMLVLMMLASCASAEGVRIAALKGPTAMGMVEMMENDAVKYSFEICAAADEITPRLAGNNPEFDIAALPANLASVLYNRTSGGLKV
ncbi:MAG: ABC transporter substrate-binding protein, partial [Clostridia bacterium]|nr:ABC transporter substrate-binding protein [Clostridia bacterium]